MNEPPAPRAERSARDGEARALAFVADLSQALAVSLDLRRTLTEAVNRIVEFMAAEAASLFLLDRVPGERGSGERGPGERDGGELVCRLCVGPLDLTGLRLAVGQGVVGRAVAENACQIVTDAASDPRVHRAVDAASGFVTRSLLCAPLATANGPIGALEVVNRRGGGAFDADDARILRLLAAPTALAINNARMAAERVEQQRLRREFELARRMQKALLPARRRDAFPLLAVNVPAHEISGDFYDHFDLPDGRIGFFIGDVSGKGLDAALLMVRAASLLRWAGKEGRAPGEWLARVNDELCETRLDGRFVCALAGYCDRAGRTVHLASAGFPPALLHRDGHFHDHAAGGPPLGIIAGLAYDEHTIALDGGTLYCYSDGVSDVRDAQRRTIGAEGVRALITRYAALAPEPRLRALLGDLKRQHLVDDTTLLLIGAPTEAGLLLRRQLPAQPQRMAMLRADLRAALDAAGIDASLRERLVLAVDEACCNVIRHAYAGRADGDLDVCVRRDDDGLVFEIGDHAPPVDPAGLRAGALGECRAGGLGLALIGEVMDEWTLAPRADGRGNCLSMRKRMPASGDDDDDEAHTEEQDA